MPRRDGTKKRLSHRRRKLRGKKRDLLKREQQLRKAA